MSVTERTPEDSGKPIADAAASAAEKIRIRNWAAAYAHWSQIGFTHQTAAALASVKHGRDQDVRTWARAYMLSRTTLQEEDML
jgi:hypothetical protein